MNPTPTPPPTRTRETRRLALPPTLRAEQGKPRQLAGHAAVFGSEYRVFGPDEPVVETIAPGAFARTLKEMPDVRALFNHDSNCVLGRTSSGTLRLSEDATGLAFECDLPDTSAGRDVEVLVARGDITGCSFGFCVREYSTAKRGDGMTVYTLLDVDLYEISPAVAFPAYEDTEVSLRAARERYRPAAPASHPSLEWARRRLQLLP